MIYFVTARDIARVKIGYSTNPARRLSKLQSDSPVKLVLERVIDGEVSDELALHDLFAGHRLSGEWFNLTPEIEAHMAELPRPVSKVREMSVQAMIMAAAGVSQGYASQAASANYPRHRITIPIAVAVYRVFGKCIGPLVGATDAEIDVLEKYCGRHGATVSERAA